LDNIELLVSGFGEIYENLRELEFSDLEILIIAQVLKNKDIIIECGFEVLTPKREVLLSRD